MATGELGNVRGAVHGGLFLACVGAVAVGVPMVPWPWYLILPLVLYTLIVLAIPPLRRTAPWPAVGRLAGGPLYFTLALIVVTIGVLVGFHLIVRPDVTALAAKLPASALNNLVLVGITFSLLNALLEELLFRGVLWDTIALEWSPTVAVVFTSVAFGIGHLHGYPPGPLGAVLAGLFGVSLGLLRWWAGGLGLAVLCHICADATIFGILYFSGAFGSPGG